MLTAMLKIQWKASWHFIVALCLAALALPLASVRTGYEGQGNSIPRFLIELQLWGLLYPVLAALAGLILAVLGWHSDRKGHHIYAMLLPLPRWRYVVLRYTAGLLLLVPIAVALWVGSVAATSLVELPPGLRHFPHALALKFALSLAMLYGLAFAIAAASRRALGIGYRFLAILVAVHLAVMWLRPGTSVLWTLASALFSGVGPLAPLGGRWMLIDV